jgi:CheY-like chemotaxis protein
LPLSASPDELPDELPPELTPEEPSPELPLDDPPELPPEEPPLEPHHRRNHRPNPCRVRAPRAIMAAQDLDIAFLDVFLQGQETSVELSRELAEKAIPVLFVTGNEQECRNHRARAIGYIEKPFGRRTMIAALNLIEGLREGKPLPAEDPDGLILFRQQNAA